MSGVLWTDRQSYCVVAKARENRFVHQHDNVGVLQRPTFADVTNGLTIMAVETEADEDLLAGPAFDFQDVAAVPHVRLYGDDLPFMRPLRALAGSIEEQAIHRHQASNSLTIIGFQSC